MPRKIKDLAVKTGSYTDRAGQTKGRYENVGHILQLDDGSKIMLIKRTFNPAGVPNPDNRDTLIISVFDAKERDGNESAPAPAPTPASVPTAPATVPHDGFDDDIPF